jgi:hypothetical protein
MGGFGIAFAIRTLVSYISAGNAPIVNYDRCSPMAKENSIEDV